MLGCRQWASDWSTKVIKGLHKRLHRKTNLQKNHQITHHKLWKASVLSSDVNTYRTGSGRAYLPSPCPLTLSHHLTSLSAMSPCPSPVLPPLTVVGHVSQSGACCGRCWDNSIVRPAWPPLLVLTCTSVRVRQSRMLEELRPEYRADPPTRIYKYILNIELHS